MIYFLYKILPIKIRQIISYLLNDKFLVGVTAFVIKDKKLLLVKNTYQYNWALPGGYLKKHEDITKAIERELLEEVGLKVKMRNILEINNNKEQLLIDILVVCNYISGDIKIDKREIEQAKFFTIKNLPIDVLEVHYPYLNLFKRLFA